MSANILHQHLLLTMKNIDWLIINQFIFLIFYNDYYNGANIRHFWTSVPCISSCAPFSPYSFHSYLFCLEPPLAVYPFLICVVRSFFCPHIPRNVRSVSPYFLYFRSTLSSRLHRSRLDKVLMTFFPAKICLFKVNYISLRKRCEVCKYV